VHLPSVDHSRAFVVAAVVLLSFMLTFVGNVRGPHNWSIESVDHTPISIVNSATSIATDQAGVPHVAYSITGQDDIRYAVRENSAWKVEVVDATHWSTFVSIKVDSLGGPHVSYGTSRGVYYASKVADVWVLQVVDQDTDCGSDPQLSFDSRDLPHIAYECYRELRYASWNGTAWIREIIADATEGPSLALDASDSPHVSYSVPSTLTVKYAHKGGGFWVSEDVDAPVGTEGRGTSIALNASGWARVSYLDAATGQLKYASRHPGGWDVEVVDTPIEDWCGENLPGSSLALNRSGAPSIAYYICRGAERSVGYAWKDGSWSIEVVDSQFGSGAGPSLAIDVFDDPQISYLFFTGGYVRYAYIPRPDIEAPVSRVLPISPYWNDESVSAVAMDRTGVENVTLWYRQSADNDTTWSAWTQFSTLDSPPWVWSFSYPAGEGYYEFYTTAIDVLGNAEPPPPTADEIAGYDITPPVSAALPISPYWHYAPPLTVNATATDALSGVADVTLLYAYFECQNLTWRDWGPFGTETLQPWSWSFPFPDGAGYYKFYTISEDFAGNVEKNKTSVEAVAGYGCLPDYAPANPLPESPTVIGVSLPLQLSVDILNLGGFDDVSTTLAFFNESSPSSPFYTIQVPPIAAGGSSGPFTATWTSPSTPCACSVVASVDYFEYATELNESNNQYAWAVNVVRGPVTTLVVGYPSYTSPATLTFVKSTTPFDFSVLDQSGLGIRNTTYTADDGNTINYTATGTFFLAGEGVHKIEWQSLDWAGNLEDVNSMNLTVDDTPPATTIDQSDSQATTATIFTFTATDSGCGVNVTKYRIDGGSWAVYSGGFTLPEGEHNISYSSDDMLNNTEREKWLVVNVSGPQVPPIEVAVNYKPIVAVIFAIILAVTGVWSSKRRPWKGGKDRMAVAKAFAITSLPFVLAEAVTGILSFATGELGIPPYVGIGTAIDLTILLAGLGIVISRLIMKA
jgi:hypothetical protein